MEGKIMAENFWAAHPEGLPILKKMWLEGIQARDIFFELRKLGNLTKNAVIGKAHRLGLPQHQTFTSRQEKKKRNKQKRKPLKILTEFNGHFKATAETPPPDGLTDLPEETTVNAMNILQLKKCSCRWPLGEPKSPDFKYCGTHKVAKSPYCAHHTARAFNKPRDPKSRPYQPYEWNRR